MIWIIIFGVLLLIGLVFIILGATGRYSTTDGDEISIAAGGIVGGTAVLGLVLCGILCLMANNPAYIKSEEYKLSEKVKLFQNNKTLLESYHLVTDDNGKTVFTSDFTIEMLSTAEYYQAVENYNTEIYEFKTKIKTEQFDRLYNPWINWMVCPACFSVSDETLDSLAYSIGK